MECVPRQPVDEILATMEMLREHTIRAFIASAKSNRGPCAMIPMTLPQVRALEIIATNRGMTNKQLATALQVSPASSSAMVDRLVELKLVERYTPEEDRRTVKLQASSLGAKIYRARRQIVERVITDLFDHLGEADARKWLQVSRKLRNILSAPAAQTVP